jgi:hypothetical protein
MATYIKLTGYAGGTETNPPIWLNADLIVTMKRLPGYVKGTHTVVELTDGIKVDVAETPEQVIEVYRIALAN